MNFLKFIDSKCIVDKSITFDSFVHYSLKTWVELYKETRIIQDELFIENKWKHSCGIAFEEDEFRFNFDADSSVKDVFYVVKLYEMYISIKYNRYPQKILMLAQDRRRTLVLHYRDKIFFKTQESLGEIWSYINQNKMIDLISQIPSDNYYLKFILNSPVINHYGKNSTRLKKVLFYQFVLIMVSTIVKIFIFSNKMRFCLL